MVCAHAFIYFIASSRRLLTTQVTSDSFHYMAVVPSLLHFTISQIPVRLNNETLPGATIEAINLRLGTPACWGHSLSPPCK